MLGALSGVMREEKEISGPQIVKEIFADDIIFKISQNLLSKNF